MVKYQTPEQQLRLIDQALGKYAALLDAQKTLTKSTLNFRKVWVKSHEVMLKSVGPLAQSSEKMVAPTQSVYAGQVQADYAKESEAAKAMTAENFETWIAQARRASEFTRTTFSATISTIGQGISSELVDGTYAWRDAWKAVLKQVIATAAEIAIIQGLMALMTGGTSAAAGKGGSFLGSILGLHEGGPVPRHHVGVLSRREHPAILERGEYVLRKEAVRSVGVEPLDRLNRTGQLTAGPTFNVSINVAGGDDPRRLAEQLAEPLIEILRRETGRGRTVISN